ncbi:hypothetical protein THOM_0086, partial [Trachipleistophora hominis]
VYSVATAIDCYSVAMDFNVGRSLEISLTLFVAGGVVLRRCVCRDVYKLFARACLYGLATHVWRSLYYIGVRRGCSASPILFTCTSTTCCLEWRQPPCGPGWKRAVIRAAQLMLPAGFPA